MGSCLLPSQSWQRWLLGFHHYKGDWPWCSLNKQISRGWHGVWPHGVLSVLWGYGSGCMQFQVAAPQGDCYHWGWRGLLPPPGTFLQDEGLPWICLEPNCIQSQVLGYIWWCGCWFCHWHLGWCHHGGQSWVGGHRLCNHSHLELPLYWCFHSLLLCILGYWVFLGKEFLSDKNMLVHSWLPSFPSSSR